MRKELFTLLKDIPMFDTLLGATEASRAAVEKIYDTHPEQALDMMLLIDCNMLDAVAYYQKVIAAFLKHDVELMEKEAMETFDHSPCGCTN